MIHEILLGGAIAPYTSTINDPDYKVPRCQTLSLTTNIGIFSANYIRYSDGNYFNPARLFLPDGGNYNLYENINSVEIYWELPYHILIKKGFIRNTINNGIRIVPTGKANIYIGNRDNKQQITPLISLNLNTEKGSITEFSIDTNKQQWCNYVEIHLTASSICDSYYYFGLNRIKFFGLRKWWNWW